MKQRRLNLKIGDLVVYTKEKRGLTPGPRATEVFPEHAGDGYHYLVDKQWIVVDVLPDGRLRLRTRTGKLHDVAADDRHLRRATLWDRLRYRKRFPRSPVAASG